MQEVKWDVYNCFSGMTAPGKTPGAPDGAAPAFEVSSDPRWHLVERILVTLPFQKSVNLHALLSYLARSSIQGKTEAMTERQIGIAVFGKPPGYSPAEDSAVRVHVRQLRLRLHEYFAQDGRNEPLRVDIPKGSYSLEFHAAGTETLPHPSPPTAQAAPAESHRPRTRDLLFWAVLVCALICAAGWYRAAHVGVHTFVPWPLNTVMQPDRQTRIVVSDANLSALRLLVPKEITLEQYLQPGFRQNLRPKHLDEGMTRMMNFISESELTSFADAAVVATLAKLAGPAADQVSLSWAGSLDRRDLEDGNYIFVGSSVSNPWVALFADKLNFQVVEESVGGRMYFRNRAPQPGEQQIYQALVSTGSMGDDYATISVLPGPAGQGNVMILQGLRQEGTEALSMLLTDSGDRAALKAAVQKVAGKSPYFEALIRARAVAGAPVSSIDIVAARRIQP